MWPNLQKEAPVFSLKKGEPSFVLHLKTLPMLKAEQSLHLLITMWIQEESFAEGRVSLHMEGFNP